MDPSGIGLFDLADRRLAWLDRRQTVLADNIANADTPRWKSRDLSPFSASIGSSALTPVRTDPRHIALAGAAPGGAATAATGERAPDGNAVSLDQELLRVAQTDTQHALVTDLYKKYIGLFRIALGR